VEDFAVEGDPEATRPIVHGLIARNRIDDAEAGMREADVAVSVHAQTVWSTMTDHLNHWPEQVGVCTRAIKAEKTRYSTHIIFAPFQNPSGASRQSVACLAGRRRTGSRPTLGGLARVPILSTSRESTVRSCR